MLANGMGETTHALDGGPRINAETFSDTWPGTPERRKK
jgi:hypothetical protein